MACAALCAACSGVGGDPLDDGGSAIDAAEDHKVGVTLDGGADAQPTDAATCPFEDADPNIGHSVCYPVPDSKCDVASACGTYKYHYTCTPNNDPPTNLNCVNVGNNDYCCSTSACVEDFGNPMTNCDNAPFGYTEEVACPPGDAPPKSVYESPSDSGVTWYCVPPQ